MSGLTITKQVHFKRGRGRRKELTPGDAPKPALGTVPRISRLMALAVRMQELVDTGEVADYAELARLAHVTRARMTQIMNLLLLAPDIQEELLFLPMTNGSRAPIRERMVRPVAAISDWGRQRKAWGEVRT